MGASSGSLPLLTTTVQCPFFCSMRILLFPSLDLTAFLVYFKNKIEISLGLFCDCSEGFFSVSGFH